MTDKELLRRKIDRLKEQREKWHDMSNDAEIKELENQLKDMEND